MRYPRAYKVEGKEVQEFKDLSDEQALKVVALIYNVAHESWEDGAARSIALEKYLTLLAKRRSAYIRDSGVFGIKYDKVNLASWKDDDVVKLYNALIPAADSYYMDTSQDLTDIENARRIMYLTALNSLDDEMKRRDMKRSAVAMAGNVLMTALMVALSMI
jgi:hypothetical protein